MLRSFCRATAVGVCIALLSLAAGCPLSTPPPVPPSPTAAAWLPPPPLNVAASPIFRLVIPPNRANLPSRLVVLLVRVDNVDDQQREIRPERILLELPDGSRRFALDHPRALELLRRSILAPPEVADAAYYPSAGGLPIANQSYWHGRVRAELFPDRLLAPEESAEGYVIVDTGRRFWSLRDAAIEAFAEPPQSEPAVLPARNSLGPALEVGP